jgi:hypothetical protein
MRSTAKSAAVVGAVVVVGAGVVGAVGGIGRDVAAALSRRCATGAASGDEAVESIFFSSLR